MRDLNTIVRDNAKGSDELKRLAARAASRDEYKARQGAYGVGKPGIDRLIINEVREAVK